MNNKELKHYLDELSKIRDQENKLFSELWEKSKKQEGKANPTSQS